MSHAHEHHTHDHAHDHEHDHDGDDYFLDQLCLIAVSGAFGAICLTMFFWKTSYLSRILAPQFFLFILLSGIALMVLFAMRAVAVWRLAGKSKPGHSHDHGHTHDHGHAHDHSHDHAHEHGNEHSHGHGAEHEHLDSDFTPAYPTSPSDHGHEHGFAPWRYVILIIPMVLFFLDLPRPKRARASTTMDVTQDAKTYAGIVAAGFNPLGQLSLATAFYADDIDPGDVVRVFFKTLEAAAYMEQTREFYDGKAVEVWGEFALNPQNDHMFSLVRHRIQCCGADAIALYINAVCKESLADLRDNKWVKVVGRVGFQKGPGGRYVTILRVSKHDHVQPYPSPPDPYIQ